MEIREIKFDSPEYKAELDLRERMLRTPIGLTLSERDTDLDAGDIHFGAFDGVKLVGCCLLRANGEQAKMRQVAVDSSAQGQGVGRKLVSHFETRARELGFREIFLEARQTAVPFYQAVGYSVVSDVYLALNVPHLKMSKSLE